MSGTCLKHSLAGKLNTSYHAKGDATTMDTPLNVVPCRVQSFFFHFDLQVRVNPNRWQCGSFSFFSNIFIPWPTGCSWAKGHQQLNRFNGRNKSAPSLVPCVNHWIRIPDSEYNSSVLHCIERYGTSDLANSIGYHFTLDMKEVIHYEFT